jgi:hypothetical protein
MATLMRHPKLVDTALGDRPNPEKSLEKLVDKWTLGRSSATTTQVRTQAKFRPRCLSSPTEVANPLVHNSITPKEKRIKLIVNEPSSIEKVLKNVFYHKSRKCLGLCIG